jgi:hypothetical protein
MGRLSTFSLLAAVAGGAWSDGPGGYPSPYAGEPRQESASGSYPVDFDREIAIFLHKRVGLWTVPDATRSTLPGRSAASFGGPTFAPPPANKGRTFYSYQNRRLDVLVAPDGKVISLGLY